MARVEDLAERYGRHIATPWQRTVAGAQRVVMVVYDKELERTLRARKAAFEMATRNAGHDWHEVDVNDAFAHWMADQEYKEEYFAAPDDLRLKLESELPEYVAERIRSVLNEASVNSGSVVAVFGAGGLFGLTHMARVINLVESDIRGRLVVFYPGQRDKNGYRMFDGRVSWDYLAIPITLHSEGATE